MSDIKRTFFAGLLIAGILMLMPLYFNFIGYESNPVTDSSSLVPEKIIQNDSQEIINKPTQINSPISSSEVVTYTISNNKFDAVFSSLSGGSLINYSLKNTVSQYRGGYNESGQYQDSIPVSLLLNNKNQCAPCVQIVDSRGNIELLNIPFELKESSGLISKINNTSNKIIDNSSNPTSLVFHAAMNNFHIIKTITVFHDSFVVNHSVEVASFENNQKNISVALIWDKGLRNTEYNLIDEISYSLASIGSDKKIENISLSPSKISDNIEKESYQNADWAAIRNKYFIMAMVPTDKTTASFEAASYMLGPNKLVPSFSTSVLANGVSTINCDIFLGPLDLNYINQLDTYLDRIMNFGWFVLQPFSRSILWLLKSLHGLGLNYGIILILFAFIVRVITGPLTKKSHESAQKMQALQPKLKKLQEKYKKDPQKLNQETMKLYKESGTNPLGGCFPMLLQMPLLFSLFIVFRSTIEFRGAPFIGWISNLSQPDTIINLPINIPLYGDQIAFLPILLGITMFLSQRVSMAAADPKQKPLMYIMSIFFYLIFNSFPSGLNLYYVVYNILNYLQQRSLKQPT